MYCNYDANFKITFVKHVYKNHITTMTTTWNFDLISVEVEWCRKCKEQLKCLISMCKIYECPNKDAKKIQKTKYWNLCWKKDRLPVSWKIETFGRLWCDITIQDTMAGLHSKCWVNSRFMQQNSTLLMKQQFVLTHTIHKTEIPTLPDRWVTNTHSCKKFYPT